MDERLKAIDEYYTNLEYRLDKEKQQMKVAALAKEVKFTNFNNSSERFFKMASIMKKNLSVFQSVFKHTDSVTTIIEYLNDFGMRLLYDKDENYEKVEIIKLAIYVIVLICEDAEMQIFLQHAIYDDFNNFSMEEYNRIKNYIHGGINYNSEVIILADSDLCAVVNCLRKYKQMPWMAIKKIWIQEPVKEKFVWLVKEYFGIIETQLPILFNISPSFVRTFRTKNELFTADRPDRLNFISIWTEDITFAKNLALSLNGNIVFINSHIDFYGDIVPMSYIEIYDKPLYKRRKANLDNCTKDLSVQKNIVYNLFYDGTWQQPIKGTYWIHDDSQWANATGEDVDRCFKSAEKGFKIWSTKSITCRMQVLFNFASILERNSKTALEDIISTLPQLSCIHENSSLCSQSGRLEVTKIRNPKGVIILKEEDETVLFRRLIQILTIGNSVIVICDTNSCNLALYCNMFSACEIPPGVINLLSNKDTKELEMALCGTDYANYAKQFFSENDPKKIYMNLTISKQILLSLK